jgi:hypothetical protein
MPNPQTFAKIIATTTAPEAERLVNAFLADIYRTPDAELDFIQYTYAESCRHGVLVQYTAPERIA